MLECIDVGLDHFGSTAKEVIYFRLRTAHNLQKKDVPRKPDVFSNVIREMFGAGSALIEDRVVSAIIDGLHPTNVKKTDSVVRAITEARRELFEKRIDGFR